jgi:hypothetical protein
VKGLRPTLGTALANHAESAHTPSMTLKGAAFLAMIGTILLAALLLWNLIFTVLNVLRGLVAADLLLSSLIYTFAGVSVAVFFYVFHKKQA